VTVCERQVRLMKGIVGSRGVIIVSRRFWDTAFVHSRGVV
jgi:hypothetical protein